MVTKLTKRASDGFDEEADGDRFAGDASDWSPRTATSASEDDVQSSRGTCRAFMVAGDKKHPVTSACAMLVGIGVTVLGALVCLGVVAWMYGSSKPSGGGTSSGEASEHRDGPSSGESGYVEVAPHPGPLAKPRWVTSYNFVLKEQGRELSSFFTTDPQECLEACDKNVQCGHAVTCNVANGMTCHLKDAQGSASSPREYNQYCSSILKTIDAYVPGNPRLLQPSDGRSYTFYMYRAKSGGTNYPLENVNTASIGGILWYLHNEVIYVCDGSGWLSHGGWGDRKFAIDRIQRYKVTMKATQPLLDIGMNFAAYKSFDSGEATGPFVMTWHHGRGRGNFSLPEWSVYGFSPGCAFPGKSPLTQRDFSTAQGYPNSIWYSLPGSCPTKRFDEVTPECRRDLPGGLCTGPTGQGNCTYRVEDAGYLILDELVGIVPHWHNRSEFCTKCKSEGSVYHPGGCGLSFWNPNIFSTMDNAKRVERTLKAFEDKYPDLPKESELDPAFCDTDMQKYGFNWYPV